MVESPEALLFEPLALDETDATISKTEPELFLVKQQPITSSFRRTVKHLQSKGGFRARFRGISLFCVYNLGLVWISKMLAVLPFIPRGTAPVFATVIFANLQMAWTHIVISDPSPKPWFKRLPSAKLFKKVAGPTAVLAIVEQLAVIVPTTLALFYGVGHADPSNVGKTTTAEKNIMVLQGISVIVLGLAMSLFMVLPANIALTRVQASLLADTEETIVPFDRSFGGKVIPEIVGGSGVVSVLDAFKTFDWNARARLIKAYVKVFAMQLVLGIFFLITIAAEVLLIVGKSDLKKIMPSEPKAPKEDGMFYIL